MRTVVEHHSAPVIIVLLIVILRGPRVEEGAVLSTLDGRLGGCGRPCRRRGLEEVVDVFKTLGIAFRRLLDDASFPMRRSVSSEGGIEREKTTNLPRSSPNMYRSGLSPRFSRPAPVVTTFFFALCFALEVGAGWSYMSSSDSLSAPLAARSKKSSARS
jgi:hypothetical protein